ncbi:NnrU family protein [Kaustia mangrovi]|uniref:NnrU family protein n=1 Tax=Kaustia mangrovi TaxID=2593653 RepID=A0A7S8HDH2_9HYPH|nr:NnrU family protein [Kaustia mangrovi]QPC44671.1 NnrU family protein [Kaustia mangrovi]
MTTLIVGIVIFFGLHLVPLTPLRDSLMARMGKGPYKGAFSVASLVGLGIMIWGFAQTRYGPAAAEIVYWPPVWGRHLTMLLVLLAFISLAIYLHKGRMKRWLKHPLAIAIALWATGHLVSNGDLGSVLFFGAFLVFGLLDIVVQTARGRVAQFTVKPRHDYIAPVAGIVMYAVVLYLHPWLFGATVVNF